MEKHFPVIDLLATGKNIARLRKERGLSVRDLQGWFGFEEPQAIYKWQWGKSLPSVDNLLALSALFGVPMDAILITDSPTHHTNHPLCNSEAVAPAKSAMASPFSFALFRLQIMCTLPTTIKLVVGRNTVNYACILRE